MVFDGVFCLERGLLIIALGTLSAIVWGASAKHARGQKVGLDHVLEDEDGTFRALIYQGPGLTTAYSRSHLEEVKSRLLILVTPTDYILYHVLPPTPHASASLYYARAATEQLEWCVAIGLETAGKSLKVG